MIRGDKMSRIERAAFSVGEAAKLLGRDYQFVYRRVRSGEIPATQAKKGGKYMISRIELQKWWKDRGGGKLFGDVNDEDSRIGEQANERLERNRTGVAIPSSG